MDLEEAIVQLNKIREAVLSNVHHEEGVFDPLARTHLLLGLAHLNAASGSFEAAQLLQARALARYHQ